MEKDIEINLLSEKELLFKGEGGTSEIQFEVNDSWTAEVLFGDQWCHIDTLFGEAGQNKISLKMDKNPDAARDASVRITSGYKYSTIIISQEEGAEISMIENIPGSVKAAGETKKVKFTSNKNWRAEQSSEDSWVELSQSEGVASEEITLDVVVAPNTGNSRSARIKLIAEDEEITLVVTQTEGGQINFISNQNDAINYIGGKIEIVFKINKGWTAHVSEGSAWSYISPTSGMAGESLRIIATFEPNTKTQERKTKITIACDGAEEIVEIVQSAMPSENAYFIGDLYPNAEAPIGVVFYIDPKGDGGKIVSFEQFDEFWGPEGVLTGANSLDDGLYNMSKIFEIENYQEDYAGFHKVHQMNVNAGIDVNNYKSGQKNVWYFAAQNELLELLKVKDKVNSTLTQQGKDFLSGSVYMSSTEADADNMYYVSFWDGSNGGDHEKELFTRLIRAVYEF